MGWIFYSARERFGEYQNKWNDINKSIGNHILLDAFFVGSLIRHFASDNTLLGIADEESNRGMVVVEKTRRGFWQTFQPSQGPLGLILLANSDNVECQIGELIRCLPGYCLGFSVTQQDPDYTTFAQLSSARTVEIVKYIDTSRIVPGADFDVYWNQTGRYFVDDLRRQTRRLDEQGIRMEFVVERNPARVGKCIRDYAELEGSGWKGKEGSAVKVDNPQGLFYCEIMEHFCSRGEGVIYQLLFNGTVVACDLCLERDGMVVVLKIAYDESLKGISPGKFIHREILRSLFGEKKVKVLEWYGRVHEWQQKLNSKERAMFHVNCFRNNWVRAARSMIKRTARLQNYRSE
jgi:hypothetical protein